MVNLENNIVLHRSVGAFAFFTNKLNFAENIIRLIAQSVKNQLMLYLRHKSASKKGKKKKKSNIEQSYHNCYYYFLKEAHLSR